MSRTSKALSSGWVLGVLCVATASFRAGASAPPAIADVTGALEAATARWSLLKCPTPHAIQLEPAASGTAPALRGGAWSWIVRFRIMGAKDPNQWRIDSAGAIAGVCDPSPKLAAPSDLAGFVKALRVALPESKTHLDEAAVYAIHIKKRTNVWRVGFDRMDRDKPGGETTVVLDARSFRVRIIERPQ